MGVLDGEISWLYRTYMNESTRASRKSRRPSTEELMHSLLEAAHSLEKRCEDALGKVGLSIPKFSALTHLVQAGGPLTLSECAEKMTCVRSNITQLMDRLEADGLVRRLEDPLDRRAVRAAPTSLGVERQAAGAKEIEKVQKEFAKTLSGTDQEALRRALDAIK
jgi:DNA-binding MarR family transcriptional regulator